METIATLFAGGEGVGVGARAAGLHHLWGIEWDDDIAQTARTNGFSVVTADVTRVNPADFQKPDILHASPPCPNFSNAKVDAREDENDIRLARTIVRFLKTMTPHIFTLENVWLYRKSESWRLIVNVLNRLGYWTDVQHLNAADFGVPQTRKRMIVRAAHGGWLPPLPPPEPWRGWYSAIEDLLPDCPDSEFAPWQLARLPDFVTDTLVDSAGYPDDTGATVPVTRMQHEPSNTIVANFERRPMRAFIVDGQNSGRNVTFRNADDPMFTCTNASKAYPRVSVRGRVVSLIPRCLARLQSFPDWYELPDSNPLACRVIGNAVPPLMYQKIVNQFLSCCTLSEVNNE